MTFEERLKREQEIIRKAVEKGKVITLVTYTLRETGEARLKAMIETILDYYQRMDLMEVLYTSTKEMVINATKANLKRILFANSQYNADDPDDYNRAMGEFKEEFNEENLNRYEQRFKENQFPVDITLVHNSDRILLKVKNRFVMYPQEEERVRIKAAKAMEYEDLIQFYMEQGDSTEGAGMGITLITILLRQAGIDPHCFSIFSNEYNETVARVEIPLNPNYTPKRVRNQQMIDNGEIDAADLRQNQFTRQAQKA
jgi:hypothetical protein